MSIADIQTILDLKCKEIETLKGNVEELTKENELMELHFEELRQLYLKEKSDNYRLMEEIHALKEENEVLASEIREYNTVDPNDMTNMDNYDKWLDSEQADALEKAYYEGVNTCIDSDYEMTEDDELVMIDYPELVIIK